jgi:hypothetical protein
VRAAEVWKSALQEYLIRLLGRYRDFVAPDAHADHYEGHPNGRAEPDGCLR